MITSIFGGGIFPVKYPGKWKPESIAKAVKRKNKKAQKVFFYYLDETGIYQSEQFELNLQTLEIRAVSCQA